MNFDTLRQPNMDKNKNPNYGYGGKEKYKDLYERVTEKAIANLKMLNINSETIERAVALMEDPIFRKKIKDGWDSDTLRGVINSDPEKQDELWAKGLAQRIKEELLPN